MSINNKQPTKFTEHIFPPREYISLVNDIKSYQTYIKQKYFPEPIRKTPKTSKAIVGLDIIQVPSHVSQYWPKPKPSVKKFVRERDNYTCQLCGKPDSRVVDHIIPLRISHDSSESNLRTLCVQCNISTRLQRRDARLDYDTWAKLLKESVTPVYLLPAPKVIPLLASPESKNAPSVNIVAKDK